MKSLLDKEQLEEFMSELESLATYNNETITNEEYKDFLDKLKKDAILLNFNLPEFFKGARNKNNFRKNMQLYGGYSDRRRQLENQFDDILNIYEGYNFNKNSNLDRKTITKLIKSTGYITSKFGEIHDLHQIGEGANGIVYSGIMSKSDIAIKILVNSDNNKKNRFICEFCNVMLKINGKPNIAKVYFFDDIKLNNSILPVIIMKKYKNSLKYNPDLSEEELIKYFKQLINALDIIHKNGMVHRDLKPQNLLVDDFNNIYIGDFGIAFYDPAIFEKTGNTQVSDRLANFNFSAPEQGDSKCKPHPSMDIYALGQIMQWLAYNKVHKGTNRKKLIEKYNTSRMELLDRIIEKCLDNDPESRYQNIDEIKQEIDKYNKSINDDNNIIKSVEELDYWNDVMQFFKNSGKIVLYTNLIGTSAYEINNTTIGILFDREINSFAKAVLSKNKNVEEIKKTIFEFLGKNMDIQFIEKVKEKQLII